MNKYYSNIFLNKNVNIINDIKSELVMEIYPRNCKINVVAFYVIAIWYLLTFILYLLGSYYRVLPFLDARNLCDYCESTSDGDGDGVGSIQICFCIDLKCCNDMNELDELIETEQKLLEKFSNDNEFDRVVEDLIDVEILDPTSNEYITITVTFRTAFFILMSDENYREWKYREKFAVSRTEELLERYEKLGPELTWKSIYPRQCLFFSSITLSVAMILIAIIQASLT